MAKPIVAIVGRPNVGKSTLFNKLVGERRAIVDEIPGTTRDRIYGTVEWNGIPFTLIDTGGLEFGDLGEVNEGIMGQAEEAIERADVILFVVDAMEGPSAVDYDVADLLRRTDRPVILVANKADNPQRTMNAVEFYQLGMGEPIAVSSIHGYGTGDLLDEVVRGFSKETAEAVEEVADVRLAIVGRPNVGKSSLVNALAGESRVMVSSVPGTTRDAIDTLIQYKEKSILLVDTAGIRRRGRIERGIEKYSVIRAVQAVERSDVAALVIDAEEGVTAQDAHVASYVLDAAKGMMLVANKWDLVKKGPTTTAEYTRTIRQAFRFMDYVPLVFTSALTKQRVTRILDMAVTIAEERKKRIPTSILNGAIQEAFVNHPPPSARGRALKLLYVTQAGVEPPTFVLFVNEPKLAHFSYVRYLENEIRARWGFEGTPIRIVLKPRSERE
ncbi:MAG: ribosome biogenesis GTPase Der [Chloroflexota bacterium]